jgi:hypothetical protein
MKDWDLRDSFDKLKGDFEYLKERHSTLAKRLLEYGINDLNDYQLTEPQRDSALRPVKIEDFNILLEYFDLEIKEQSGKKIFKKDSK